MSILNYHDKTTTHSTVIKLVGIEHLRGDGRPLLLLDDEPSYQLAARELRAFVDVALIVAPLKTIPVQMYPYLLPYRHILVVHKRQAIARLPRTRHIPVPVGESLVDFYQAGGNLPKWIKSQLVRLGIVPSVVFPKTVTLSLEVSQLPGLALPNGRWQRLSDGRITVTFNSQAEYDTCNKAIRAIRKAEAQRLRDIAVLHKTIDRYKALRLAAEADLVAGDKEIALLAAGLEELRPLARKYGLEDVLDEELSRK